MTWTKIAAAAWATYTPTPRTRDATPLLDPSTFRADCERIAKLVEGQVQSEAISTALTALYFLHQDRRLALDAAATMGESLKVARAELEDMRTFARLAEAARRALEAKLDVAEIANRNLAAELATARSCSDSLEALARLALTRECSDSLEVLEKAWLALERASEKARLALELAATPSDSLIADLLEARAHGDTKRAWSFVDLALRSWGALE